MLEEALVRGWENFIDRTTGPMNFRFILQPTIASILAILAGMKDAREGRPAFFWSILTKSEERRPLLKEGFKDISKVFVVAIVLDSIYQIITQGRIYPLELIFTAFTLAFIPYMLIRGPANHIATFAKSVADRRRTMMGKGPHRPRVHQ